MTPPPTPVTPVDDAPRTDPGTHWDRLFAALTGRLGPDAFQPPATAEAIAALEAAYGYPLPEALRAGWLRHNGQREEDYRGLLFGDRWLSVEDCLAQLQFHQESTGVLPSLDRQEYVEAGGGERLVSVPPGAVRLYLRHPAWLPLFGADGTFLAVDMAPGPAGRAGQLIVYDNADAQDVQRTVVARDFHALLAWMDAEATAGRLVFDCEDEDEEDDGHDHVEDMCSLRHADGWSLLGDLVRATP